MTPNRRIERLRSGTVWKWDAVQMREIQKGDVFRMFEMEGEPVGGEGQTFEATDDAYCPPDKVWGVSCKELTHNYLDLKERNNNNN